MPTSSARCRSPARQQSEKIAASLADHEITRIVSSPYVRCVQTVEPLASQLGIPVDVSDALSEGAPFAESAALLDKLSREHAVLCTHGDVLGDLLMHVADQGVRIDDLRLEKGSIWVLECADGQVRSARYVPPPA